MARPQCVDSMRQPSPGAGSGVVIALLVQVYTVDIGVAVGQSCMLLAAGAKGHRFMLEHATGEPQISLRV